MHVQLSENMKVQLTVDVVVVAVGGRCPKVRKRSKNSSLEKSKSKIVLYSKMLSRLRDR